ncbi:hypothetical protein [Methylocystis hirsuta]|nr:hypothetical protein [Methylocystis hirsuta]
MSDEPENFTLALLRKIDGKVDNLASEVADMRKAMATKSDVADVRSELRSEIHSLRADVASDMMNLEKQIKEQEKRLSDQISGLRRSVMEYHSSQIGHGVLLTEFEERLRRLEEHVGLPPEGH